MTQALDLSAAAREIDAIARGWRTWQTEIERAAATGAAAVRQAVLPTALFESLEHLTAPMAGALALAAITDEWQRAAASPLSEALHFRETFGASVLDHLSTMATAESEEEFLGAGAER
jgi:hypothetical protein